VPARRVFERAQGILRDAGLRVAPLRAGAGGEVLRPTLEAGRGGSWHTEAWRLRTTADTTRTAKKGGRFRVFYEIRDFGRGQTGGFKRSFGPSLGGSARCLKSLLGPPPRRARLGCERRQRRAGGSAERAVGAGRERPGGNGASARLPCTCEAVLRLPRSRLDGPAPCGACALARPRGWRSHGTSATRLVGFAANEGGAARRALFRVEHRASDSPAQRRAGERAERAVGLGARGRAIRARRPHSGAWARRAWASCSPPPPVLASHRPGARAVPHALLRPHECHAISPARCPRRAT
jgi:hypothetical protein